jgi:hypothetical protein
MDTAADAAAAADADADADADVFSVISMKNDKRERKHTAKALPPGITQSMMKKYVVYYRETVYLKNGKTQPREYFKVESHPGLTKPWVSSKSTKISLLEKLAEANQFVATLDDASTDVTKDDNRNITMPKYTSLHIVKDTPETTTMSLVYDCKDKHNGFRWTGSHTFTVFKSNGFADVNAAVSLEMTHLRNKLREKYAVDVLLLS